MVILSEGDNVNISCSSAGVPIPTITWTLRDQTTSFEQTDVQTDIIIFRTRDDDDNLVTDVTPGILESTLQIVNAQYTAHDQSLQVPNFFSHIKLSKYAYFWRFSHINVTSDSDSIKVIIMAKIHYHCF